MKTPPDQYGRWPALAALALTVLLCLTMGALAAPRGKAAREREQLMVRARVVQLTPAVDTRIRWRYGGEGLGGDVVSGELTRETLKASEDFADDLRVPDGVPGELDDGKPTDRTVAGDDTYDYHYLKVGVWSWWHPVSTFRGARFITFTLDAQEAGPLREGILEFEFAWRGEVVKTLRVEGPDGPTFGVVLPVGRLAADGSPTNEFIAETRSLREYSLHKLATLEALPWHNLPTPTLYGFLTDCGGYGTNAGYGTRTSDPLTALTEARILRAMGCNGSRATNRIMQEEIANATPLGREFGRVRIGGTTGYPIPAIDRADGRPPVVRPGDGCPYDPANRGGIPARVAAAMEKLLDRSERLHTAELWALTDDEIGSCAGLAPEGAAHFGVCPACREAFREFVKRDGRTLADFGAPDWADVRPTTGYWGRSYWEIRGERADELTEAKDTLAAEGQSMLAAEPDWEDDPDGELVAALDDAGDQPEAADEVLAAKAAWEQLVWRPSTGQQKPADATHRLSPEGWHLLNYYTRRFVNETSAGLFTELRDAFAAANERKRQALAAGQADGELAKQPWVYSYALRGNTFLMGGGSLDFFDFYRGADNGFVYETSNRDSRVWQWDSYLCDVGRSLQKHLNQRFGIYVKPHRGAPIQRTLTAVARGARMIYWYTYGPEWSKGDSFGGNVALLGKLSWTARLVAGAEPRTYDADWARPAEIAIVRPLTAEYFSGNESWENGKWVHAALMHSQLPMDALDEGLLLSLDISRYRVIYLAGDHLQRRVAEKLRGWVEQGGTLVTMGHGLSRDEAGRPLDLLYPVFGVTARGAFDKWGGVGRYGAVKLGGIRQIKDAPEGAQLNATLAGFSSFVPKIGREILLPAEGTEVVAHYADGGAAITKHRFGQGTAWLIGQYAGLEYASETMARQPFRADKRALLAMPALAAGVQPVVSVDEPLCEGLLLRHPTTGQQTLYLINWAHKTNRPVTVRLRPVGSVTTATAVGHPAKYPLTQDGDWLQFTLPTLAEGEVLLLD